MEFGPLVVSSPVDCGVEGDSSGEGVLGVFAPSPQLGANSKAPAIVTRTRLRFNMVNTSARTPQSSAW
jgi:hypothetical protein